MPPRVRADLPAAMPRLQVSTWSVRSRTRGWDEFEPFFHDGYPRLTAQLHAIIDDPDQARAAAQYAFGRAWRHWGRVARLTDPAAWLRNEAATELTRPTWRQHSDIDATDHVVQDPATRTMLEALGRLTDPQRHAVVLADMARSPIEQIGHEVGTTGGATELITQARTGIAKRLATTGPAAGLNPDYRQPGGTVEDWVSRQLSALQYRLAPRVEGPAILDEIRTTDRYRRLGVGTAVAMTLLAGVGTAVAVAVTTYAPPRPVPLPASDDQQTAPPPAYTLPDTHLPDTTLPSMPPSSTMPPLPPSFSLPTTIPGLGNSSFDAPLISSVPAPAASLPTDDTGDQRTNSDTGRHHSSRSGNDGANRVGAGPQYVGDNAGYSSASPPAVVNPSVSNGGRNSSGSSNSGTGTSGSSDGPGDGGHSGGHSGGGHSGKHSGDRNSGGGYSGGGQPIHRPATASGGDPPARLAY
jgi:DNA-directed RNA polymerase specialized sigma24 family protein